MTKLTSSLLTVAVLFLLATAMLFASLHTGASANGNNNNGNSNANRKCVDECVTSSLGREPEAQCERLYRVKDREKCRAAISQIRSQCEAACECDKCKGGKPKKPGGHG